MTEQERLLSFIDDKIRQCRENYMVTSTAFLTLSERSAATAHMKKEGISHLFYGGYPDAERTVLFFLPDYIEKETFGVSDEDLPFCVLHCKNKSGKPLSHRDYLGSLLSLGINRSMTGDILVRDDGADIFVMKSISEFLLANYEKAGSAPLNVSLNSVQDMEPPVFKTEEIRESVASLRLDNMAGAVFAVSRNDISEAIARGLLFVNDTEMTKPDFRINEGDKLVFRGHGKAYFLRVLGETRKGRLSVLFKKYL